MEAADTVVDHPEQILEKIWQQNQTLREALRKSDFQDKEKIMEYIPKVTVLLLDLMKALSTPLENTTKILQDTCQLLNTLQDKGQQQISSQEKNNPADWLLELSRHILHAVRHIEEAENKLLGKNCRKKDQVHIVPCISEKSEWDAEKKNSNSVQVLAYVNQPFHEPSSMLEEENRAQLTESQMVEAETVGCIKEKISGQRKESPALMENEDESKSDKSIRVPRKGNRKSSRKMKSSHKKSSKSTDLEDISGNNEQNTTVSKKLGNSSVKHQGALSNQEKQSKEKESPKQTKNVKHQLIGKPARMDNQNEKSNESMHSNQGSVLGFASSDDLHATSSINLSTSKLEERDSESDWMNKEFLVEMNGMNEPEMACSVTAPCSILENLAIGIVNDLSSLVVDDSEELVSHIISIECLQDDQAITSPISIAIPFTSRYRGMYKDIMVKVTDMNFQSSYLTPVSLEGHQGNHKGTFAEVKTCQIGIFSVVSCLKSETFTIPRKGLSRKLSMDSRISFCYPPSTFSSRVTMQLKVQPIEPSVLSILKTKHETYHSVVSTSPLVHVQHSSSQPFRKPITVILPCPPNPEKKSQTDEADHGRVTSASIPRATTMHNFRAMSASPRKHGENLNESLKLLGYKSKEEEWALLDDIMVRNAPRSLVSFELDEHLDSFMVLRLSSAMDNKHLVQFIQHLEEDTHNTMAKVVLYRKKEDPYKIIVLLVPARELNLELQSLREEGYSGPPEPSQQFKLREGEQIHFRFSGNIFASDDGMAFGKTYKLIFHAQRSPRLALQIKEVDEFGNYSSPHYKGTVLFYKVSKEAVAKNLEQPILPDDYQHQAPLCKLALTLPKQEKLIKRPQSTKRISLDSSEALWDNLMHWLSQELSEDNASCLALSLPLHRSTLQLIKLKCPDNLTEQIYELLCFWKRNLPRSADKLHLLSRYLCKSGRSDLAEDLRVNWESKVFVRTIH
ncbi:death domain-containing protein 1 [Hemicordylus capensis]|uniref:death domain-containing protein 1 n=1 Tax=Hemicordylus capensis TaxID=884348 RepID=UPI0023036183|nr:death domain-containing protein 1 [Hemicordylus capensis]